MLHHLCPLTTTLCRSPPQLRASHHSCPALRTRMLTVSLPPRLYVWCTYAGCDGTSLSSWVVGILCTDLHNQRSVTTTRMPNYLAFQIHQDLHIAEVSLLNLCTQAQSKVPSGLSRQGALHVIRL